MFKKGKAVNRTIQDSIKLFAKAMKGNIKQQPEIFPDTQSMHQVPRSKQVYNKLACFSLTCNVQGHELCLFHIVLLKQINNIR